MAREYSSKRSSRRGSSVPHQAMIMVVTFILGYFTASIFDIDTLSHWMTTQVLENHEVKTQSVQNQTQKERVAVKPKFEFYTLLANEKGVASNPPNASGTPTAVNSPNQATVTANNSPAPQTPTTAAGSAASTATRILANKPQPAVPHPQQAPVKVVTAKPIPTAPVRKGTFVVQVAAFKARNEAEHMKGLLVLKGFEVSVVSVATPTNGTWFRVLIGPYPNRTLAQKAQVILAKTERLNGMVRSADG